MGFSTGYTSNFDIFPILDNKNIALHFFADFHKERHGLSPKDIIYKIVDVSNKTKLVQ